MFMASTIQLPPSSGRRLPSFEFLGDWTFAVIVASALALAGCTPDLSDCGSDDECPDGQRCVSGGGVFSAGGRCVSADLVSDVPVDTGAETRDTSEGGSDVPQDTSDGGSDVLRDTYAETQDVSDGDGTTQPSTCEEIYECQITCDQGQDCEGECYEPADESAQQNYDELEACYQNNCSDTQDQESCAEDNCPTQIDSCFNCDGDVNGCISGN